MNDFTPFLQIVHISDLHVSDPKSHNAVAARNWVRRLRKRLPAIAALIEDGTAPHDPLAVKEFYKFVASIAVHDPTWSKCRTWIVDTGDLTSLGDTASLNLGRSYLNGLASVCPDLAAIYGNHDAWPGTLPLFAGNSALASQAGALTARHFSVAAPGLALRTPIPHGAGEVLLYFVDSVRHDRWLNTLAKGKVPDPQLNALKAAIDLHRAPGRRDFRILAVHHPVHYPPPRPSTQMSMSNDSHVARVLDTPSPNGAFPLAHVVLSGHTHYLYPDHGNLPSQPSLCPHHDLGDDECQLVVGTLMQLDKFNKRNGLPHQCEVLRLYYSLSDSSLLLMGRLLAARRSGQAYRGTGIGPYSFVPLNKDGKVEEEITFTVS
jgi:3',5'-cyclic AMP phosphodiesterase CpdA